MGDLYSLSNTIINFMKVTSYHGISMWFILQVLIWFNLAVWPLLMFLLNRFAGGSND